MQLSCDLCTDFRLIYRCITSYKKFSSSANHPASSIKFQNGLSVMRGSRNFRQGGGGPVQSDKKALTTFFVCFLVLSLFYRSQMVNFKEIYHFLRFQRGSNIFQRFQHFPGGGGGGLGHPLPPLDPHLSVHDQMKLIK